MIPHLSERALILAPRGRDAKLAATMLGEASILTRICASLPELVSEIDAGAGFAVVTEESLRHVDLHPIFRWLEGQPEWSDFPFVLLTERGGGPERNPVAARLLDTLGNVTFLERPFHPTTLVSLARSALRGRRRQYEARARLEALRESAEHYRNAAELNPQVAWTANPDGQLDRVAERWREWTGSSGLGDSWALGLHPDDRLRTVERWAQSVETDIPYDIEHRVQRVTGEPRWARSRAFPRFDADGRVVKWYGTTEDIHEQKLAEQRLKRMNDSLEQRVAERNEELQHAQEALRQSQKLEAMGQLTGGVAHDFNNLLTPIVGTLDLLFRKGIGTPREQQLINGALQSADRAKTLVQRLLAFARRQPLQPTAVDLKALVSNMADLISSTSGPRIQLALELDDDLPPARIDANQMEMALLNLAVNARDAMPAGGRLAIIAMSETIGPAHPSKLPPGAYIRLSVADSGIGMDEETRAKAVEPFFTTKGIGQGTGLGLSMVHGLAAQLGGALEIESTPGQGTRVDLWLPVSEEALQQSAVSGDTLPALHTGRALVVDDEELVRASTSDMLAELGYDVLQAASAEDALAMLADLPSLDLLVTDHLMPGLTGADLAARARDIRPSLRVLIVSGYAESKGLSPELPRLTKPFKQADLAASLSQL